VPRAVGMRQVKAFGRHDVAEQARRLGLERVAEELASLAEWGARLEISQSSAEDHVPRSKIGGLPELPVATPWPELDGRPAQFVAQIALSEAWFLDASWQRDASSILYFFWVRDRDRREVVGAHVFACAASGPFEPAPLPAGLSERDLLPESTVALRRELTLPAWGHYEAAPLRRLGLRNSDRELYEALVEGVERAQGAHCPKDRLLGHPAEIPDDVLVEAALMARLRSGSDDYGHADLEGESEQWRALLKIDLDLPSATAHYFCVPAADLRGGRYDRSQAFAHGSCDERDRSDAA